ncbi:MAG TPA: ATP synthase F1 subunit delta, partial [Candidatus Dormibacteraeota bacterium]|nr:ATP synthase F1 subunit delta [Candidatus Dormibacteraeota bacterium]
QTAAFAEWLLEGVDAEGGNLVRLLVQRRRTDLLPRILEQYDRLADRASGRVRAEVTTAVALDRDQEARLRQELARHLGGDVQTTVRQDPGIIGGLVVRIGDRVIDSSVRTRLRELQGALA